MKVTLILLAVIGSTLASADLWEQFKSVHNKKYVNAREETFRKSIFETNLTAIAEHNILFDLGLETYRQGLNQFADYTAMELAVMNGFKGESIRHNGLNQRFEHISSDDLPTEVDWRKHGLVTPVKFQGNCGSCWAFSTVAGLEGQHAKKTGNLVSLSEQNLVDCNLDKIDDACKGGMMDDAFEYIARNGGIDTEASYPYLSGVAEIGFPCSFNKSTIGATDTGFVSIASGDEEALKKAVATIGPISVAIDANHNAFINYQSGVYSNPKCSSTSLDHGVTVVGYGVDNGKDYWLVKNSWSTAWGEQGYVKMSRNNGNNCGIATHALYPTV